MAEPDEGNDVDVDAGRDAEKTKHLLTSWRHIICIFDRKHLFVCIY